MPEAYVWPEATLTVWTGDAVPISSAVIAYAQSVSLTNNIGWDNRVTLDGQYRDHRTGQRADVTIGAVYTYSMLLERIRASGVPVHIKADHSSVNGSAGYIYYSGRFDSLSLNGGDGQQFQYSLQYHANSWSAYGG